MHSCRKMHQSVEHYYHELAGLRTGRASPTLLDGIMVDIHGDKMNLPHVATVVMKGTRTLAVTVYDRDNTSAVSTAIRASPLELQVREEGGQLIVPVPEYAILIMTLVICFLVSSGKEPCAFVQDVSCRKNCNDKACT